MGTHWCLLKLGYPTNVACRQRYRCGEDSVPGLDAFKSASPRKQEERWHPFVHWLHGERLPCLCILFPFPLVLEYQSLSFASYARSPTDETATFASHSVFVAFYASAYVSTIARKRVLQLNLINWLLNWSISGCWLNCSCFNLCLCRWISISNTRPNYLLLKYRSGLPHPFSFI